MIIRIFFVIAAFLVASISASAQKTPVKTYIMQVAKGWTSDAKKALPDLLIDQPDDPGVTFLHATLVEDPERAMPLFERIVQNYPSNEWADDALLRVILHACIKKDAEKAKTNFRKMRDLFSQSELLPVAYDAMRMSVGVPPATNSGTANTGTANTGTTKPATTESATTKTATPNTTTSSTTSSTTNATPTSTTSSTTSSATYTLATLTTENKADADKLVEQFKKKRMRVRVSDKTIKGKRNFVVEVGEYATEVDAAKDLEAVRAVCKCKPIVVKR